MADLRQGVAALPPSTAILFTSLFRDAAGQAFITTQVGQAIAQWANVPVYAMADTIIGTGAVGGAVASVDAIGKRAGEMVRLILSGTDIKWVPFEIRTEMVPTFDWQALERWGIPESRLPPGSVVRNKPMSIWAHYRWYVIGAATVVVNYDGVAKHRTVIGDHVRDGSDSMLVAPVTIGDGAYTAAGSVITQDVPPGAMAVARGRQRNVEGYSRRTG